jgi:thiol:disulfide interchange protein DsbC
VLRVLLKNLKRKLTKKVGLESGESRTCQSFVRLHFCNRVQPDAVVNSNGHNVEEYCMRVFSVRFPRTFCFHRTFFSSLVFAALTVLTCTAAQAGDESAEVAAIKLRLMETQPEMTIETVVKSPVEGLYEVTVGGGQTIYVSQDARFFIAGDLYEAQADGLVNLGESKRNLIRKEKIAELDEADMVVYAPEGERKATVTVFTDVDCPYCRKLHAEVEALNEMGIAVRYLAFPRTGLNTETHFKMISTWCAADRQAMMTSAKRGGDVPKADCANPIESQYQLGREVGVTGTPALVLEDGTMLPGYVPAATLGAYLLGKPAQP